MKALLPSGPDLDKRGTNGLLQVAGGPKLTFWPKMRISVIWDLQ